MKFNTLIWDVFSANQDGGRLSNAEFKVIVSSDGDIVWQIYQIMHSVCQIDVSKFPFDTQQCKMKIGSWSQDVLDLDLKIYYEKTNGIDTDLFEMNTVWELKSAHAHKNIVHYKCCPSPYADITYSFEFRRKPLYYIMTIVFPSMLLSLLTSISFVFPADSGERVSLVISVLLGVVVFMLIVNERTPVTSDSVPMITHFFNSIGAATVLALLATAFILRLNHVSSDKPVPRYLVKIRDFIAATLRIKKECQTKFIQNLNAEMRQNESFEEAHVQINLRNVDRACVQFETEQISCRSSTYKTLESIRREVKKVSEYLDDEITESALKEQWQYTMRVFDKFFFVLFFLIFLGFAAKILFVCVTS